MGAESQSSRGPRVDATLGRLFDVERQIEDRLREAEREAAHRIEDARASSEQSVAESRSVLEAALREAEKEDLDRHAEALRRIERERQARLRALSSVPDAEVERLAREALTIVLEGGRGRP